MKEKIKDVFIDRTELDLKNQEIGYLKDLCDSKDMVIAYQKDLLNIQGESLKRFRQIAEELNELKETMKKKRGRKNENSID